MSSAELMRADQQLTPHQQALIEIIRDAVVPIPAGELHSRYDDTAESWYRGRSATPIGRRQRRNELQQLEEQGIIEATGPTWDRRYYLRE